MTIAFFTPALNVGGYEKVILEFANQIVKYSRHEVLIVCCSDDGELKLLFDQRVKIIPLGCKTKTLLPHLTWFLHRYKPDILYSGFRIYNTIAVLAKKISMSNATHICITQHGYERTNKKVKRIYGLVQNHADLLIGVTESLRKYESSELNLQIKSTVVGNPVIKGNENAFHVRNTNDWAIVTCGRLSRDKNYALAIDIINELRARQNDVKLVVIGDGPEKKNLEEQVTRLGLGEYVTFVGYTRSPMEYMKKCDIYLHTCDLEGFGNSVVEAMYVRLPIVTTNCGGPVDLIEQDKYGICFGNGRDENAVQNGADAIIEVIARYGNYTKQRDKAKEYVVDRVTDDLLNAFEELL